MPKKINLPIAGSEKSTLAKKKPKPNINNVSAPISQVRADIPDLSAGHQRRFREEVSRLMRKQSKKSK